MGFPVVSRTRRKQRIERFLPLRVRLSADVFTVGGAKTEQRLNQFPALSCIPKVKGDEHHHLLAMRVCGKKGQGGSLAQDSPHVEFLRGGCYKFAVLRQHLLCLLERENDQPG